MSEITEIITLLDRLKIDSKEIDRFKDYLSGLKEHMKTKVFLDIYGLPGIDTQPSLHLVINDNPASERSIIRTIEERLDIRDHILGSPGYRRRNDNTITFSFIEFLESFARRRLPGQIADWLSPYFGWDDGISPQPEMFLRKLRSARENYRFAKIMHTNTFIQLYPIGFEHEIIDDLLPKGVISKTSYHFHKDADLCPLNKILVPSSSFLMPYQDTLCYPSRPIKQSSISYVRELLLGKDIVIL